MVQILRNKGSATRFQILIEIAAHQPYIQQKDIAPRLDVTPQAISVYMEELLREKLITSDGRSKYSVTKEGVSFVIGALREIEDYLAFAKKAVTDIGVSAAIADCDLSPGQEVGLEMRGGLLIATSDIGEGASGIVVSAAGKGEDVGISGIKGIIRWEEVAITILTVPEIRKGGSRSVDYKRLKAAVSGDILIGAVGIEAVAALKRIGISPHYYLGVKEAMVEAAQSGLSFLAVCTQSEVPGILQGLAKAGLGYRLIDLNKE